MIAPEPFFEPRGTPFSEYHRIRALLELGHTVDLVTYPFGHDVEHAGAAGLPLPAAAVRHRRPHRSVAGEGAARPVAGGLGAAARGRAAATTRCTRTRRARPSASSWRPCCGVPHLYDMHSSLPQQLANFKFSRSRVLRWVFEVFERLAVRRSRVVIVICAELERQVREIAPAGGAGADRERARRRRRAAATADATRCAREFGLGPTTPLVLYTGTFEAYQGLDLLFDAAQTVRGRAPGRALPARRRAARSDCRGDAPTWPRAGWRDVVIFAGERPADRDSALPRRRRRARLAAQPRHEHAAQDLSIPARGPRHRRHAPAHAHAGALRRGGDTHRADASGVRRRASSRPLPIPRWPHAIGAPCRRTGRDQVQLRGVSRAAPERRSARLTGAAAPAAGRPEASRDAPGRARRRPPDHYSYTVYADPAMADQFDRARFSGPIGELLAATQARVLRDYAGRWRRRTRARRRHRHGPRRRWCSPRPARDVTAVDASDEMLRVAERAGRRRAASAIVFGSATPITSPSTTARSTRWSACAC